jgi:uncharacterized membrane protein YfcA
MDSESTIEMPGWIKVCWAAFLAVASFLPYWISWFSFGGALPIFVSSVHWLFPPAVAALAASAMVSRIMDFWRICRRGSARPIIGVQILASGLAGIALGASALWCLMVLYSLAYGWSR